MKLPIKLRSQVELLQLLASGALAGHAVHLVVLHDDWCPGEPCLCSPEFVVEELTAETVTRGQRQQVAWQRSKRS